MERLRAKIENLSSKGVKIDPVKASDLQRYGLKDIKLRSYQEAGVNWLLERYDQLHGCILADEMGLGKTCQTISLLVCLSGRGESDGPHLILSPLSVLDNWKSELSRFAPHLKTVTYVGDKDTRATMRSRLKDNLGNANVLLTTYEICLKDESFLMRFAWNTLVVDEAHRLKNRNSLLHQALQAFDTRNRVLLTGTPVQNNLHELYSLLAFVAPTIFRYKYCEEFVESYSNIEDQTDMSDLYDLMKPFVLRRVKSQVIRDLPNRSEVILFHGMSSLQKKYYKAILTKDTDVFETGFMVPKTRLMNILMQLRKCVNHPYLFDGVEPEPFELGEHLVEASGKLHLVDQLLGYLAARKHKVLLFSQMTHALDIVQDYLGYRGYTYERLDGSVRGEERYLAIQKFNTDSSTFVFLLSTRAGGQGLNLVAADTVIFLDSDFNPQNDLQASARAHRIGQTRPVKIIRLIGRSTVEEIILRRAEAKLKLTESVIEGDQFALGVGSSSGKGSALGDDQLKLQDILKFGVDKLLESESSTVETVDFDAILGSSQGAEWVQVEDKETMESLAAETMTVDDQGAAGDEGNIGNMYSYEGTDYSQQPSLADRTAVEILIQAYKREAEEDEGERRARRHSKTSVLAGVLPDTLRKPRRKLTTEELEEQRQKRAETAARRAEEAKAKEIERQEEKLCRRAAMWEAHGYTSYNIAAEEEEESDSEDVVMDTDDESDAGAIHYVVGDVTKPQRTPDKDAIIVHCVDDSGAWGSGGLFSALAARSSLPEEMYSLAGDMKDLSLGDAHLIPIDASEDRLTGSDYCALIIAQHRDRQNNLSGIKLSALSEGLQRIYKAARQKHASVHLPRIGHATPGFNWYGTERLIRKHLAAKGIPTYIYYFRRHQTSRKRSSSPQPQPSTSKVRRPSEENPDVSRSDLAEVSHGHTPGKDTGDLPDFMQGVTVWFLGVPGPTKARLSRYLIAYDGDIHKDIEDGTSHVVVMPTRSAEDEQEIVKVTEAYSSIPVVTTTWLDESYRKQRRVPHERHLVNTA